MQGWGRGAVGQPSVVPLHWAAAPAVLTSGQGRPCLPSPFFRMRRMCAKNSTPSPGFLQREAGPRVSGSSLKLRAPGMCLPPHPGPATGPYNLRGLPGSPLVPGLSPMSKAWTPPPAGLGFRLSWAPPRGSARAAGEWAPVREGQPGARDHTGGGHPPSPCSGGLLWVSASAPWLPLCPPAEGWPRLHLPEHTALDLQQGRHGGGSAGREQSF